MGAESFFKQIAIRIHENLSFTFAMNRQQIDSTENLKGANDNITVGGSKFQIRFNEERQ